MKHIDINCDMGEGISNEKELMPMISSCNIACGGHAGTEDTMRHVVNLAQEHHVHIGAHPSFPDKLNFGRETMGISLTDLKKSLVNQMTAFYDIAQSQNAKVKHIKPHGALYNEAVKNKKIAQIIVETLLFFDKELELFAPYDSVVSKIAHQNQVIVKYEAFADRHYNDDLSLVSRHHDDALITEPEAMFSQINSIISKQQLTSINGKKLRIKAATFCVHGDHKNAAENLKKLTQILQEKNIRIL
ncbi:MAG: 5-oxoprolinase subunit PxpA [Algicola sp.]|nr:5-oxoprolinase subunit PxpA [Algicola sp.]